ncbi:MAG: hypothetical protein COA38_14985 [Fluviicola sp.]|nr:MAG: hypothetical protein COA38_14985 [Fluviicola sp.]
MLVNVEQRGVFSLSEFWEIGATRFYSFLGIAYGTSFENYSWDWLGWVALYFFSSPKKVNKKV